MTTMLLGYAIVRSERVARPRRLDRIGNILKGDNDDDDKT